MKSIQNKGINLTAEDLKNRIADRKELRGANHFVCKLREG